MMVTTGSTQVQSYIWRSPDHEQRADQRSRISEGGRGHPRPSVIPPRYIFELPQSRLRVFVQAL